MKKVMSLGLSLLLLCSLPLRALAENETPAETAAEEAPSENTAEDTTAAEAGSIFDLLNDSHMDYQIDLAGYYLKEMYDAAVAGDIEAGREAEKNRNEQIDKTLSDEAKLSFDDLYLLAKLICSEAGCDWLSDSFRMCVGEVALNRVASPEYPNTLREVVYQKDQYVSVSSAGFESLVPTEPCVDAALRLLQGERKMVESVVFQSNTIQGELFTMFTDRKLGNTYFCLSTNQDLYPIN